MASASITSLDKIKNYLKNNGFKIIHYKYEEFEKNYYHKGIYNELEVIKLKDDTKITIKWCQEKSQAKRILIINDKEYKGIGQPYQIIRILEEEYL